MRQGGKVITFPKGKQCGGGSKASRQRVFDPLSHLNSGDNILDFEHYVWKIIHRNLVKFAIKDCRMILLHFMYVTNEIYL